MTIKISKKIVKYAVQKPEDAVQVEKPAAVAEKAPAFAPKLPAPVAAPAEREMAKVIQMHERLERPDMLIGSTYKVKTPISDHAM